MSFNINTPWGFNPYYGSFSPDHSPTLTSGDSSPNVVPHISSSILDNASPVLSLATDTTTSLVSQVSSSVLDGSPTLSSSGSDSSPSLDSPGSFPPASSFAGTFPYSPNLSHFTGLVMTPSPLEVSPSMSPLALGSTPELLAEEEVIALPEGAGIPPLELGPSAVPFSEEQANATHTCQITIRSSSLPHDTQ